MFISLAQNKKSQDKRMDNYTPRISMKFNLSKMTISEAEKF